MASTIVYDSLVHSIILPALKGKMAELNTDNFISSALDSHLSIMERNVVENKKLIFDFVDKLCNCVLQGGKILWCGNGGSAAESQHMSAELMGRFNFDRDPISSIALTTDTSYITAVGNDLDYSEIFARQIQGLANKVDVLVLMSTSGNSRNIIKAATTANSMGVLTLAMLGRDGGQVAELCDLKIIVDSSDTPRIQEVHQFMGHIICDLLEQKLKTRMIKTQ